MSHTMKSLWGVKYMNTCLSIWRISFFFPSNLYLIECEESNCFCLAETGEFGTLHATPSWRISMVLKGCSSRLLLFTTCFPQEDLGSVFLQAMHISSWRTSRRDTPSLCHWASQFHLVVSCRRWCWPWGGTSDGHWLLSPTTVPQKPFQSWMGEVVCLHTEYQWCPFLLQQGLFLVFKKFSVFLYIPSFISKHTDMCL